MSNPVCFALVASVLFLRWKYIIKVVQTWRRSESCPPFAPPSPPPLPAPSHPMHVLHTYERNKAEHGGEEDVFFSLANLRALASPLVHFSFMAACLKFIHRKASQLFRLLFPLINELLSSHPTDRPTVDSHAPSIRVPRARLHTHVQTPHTSTSHGCESCLGGRQVRANETPGRLGWLVCF